MSQGQPLSLRLLEKKSWSVETVCARVCVCVGGGVGVLSYYTWAQRIGAGAGVSSGLEGPLGQSLYIQGHKDEPAPAPRALVWACSGGPS